MKKISIILSVFFFNSTNMLSQRAELTTLITSGTIVGGYADNGAFLNFTGPGIKLQKGLSEIMVGVLPSLRFKEDNGAAKNSLITPNLGLGITYTNKFLALQIPFFYNSKTAVVHGKWNVGLGIGLKLNKVFIKNKIE
jgi:hypothetical protein